MKVSVVIPCYNASKFIAESVLSAYEQTHQDIEVICIDNNSTDQTMIKLLELQKKYPQLIVELETKKGAPAARNKGWRMAEGEWIQFLDADYLLRPDKISNQVKAAANGTVLIVGDYIRHEVESGESQKITANRDVWSGLINNQLGITTANLFNKAALEKVDGFDENLKSSQEYDLMFRMLKRNPKLVYDDTRNSIIRSRASGSISATDISGNQNRYLQLTARIALFLKEAHAKTYRRLGDKWFQDMFIRIRMNAQNGFEDSPELFDAIMLYDFKPEARPFTPKWFRVLMSIVGYKRAESMKKMLKK